MSSNNELERLAAPDLNAPHRAVTLHLKVFDEYPALVWHNRERRWCQRYSVEPQVELYADRVRGWFFDYGLMLQTHHDARFVVLMTVLSYLEGNEQYRKGEASNHRSQAFFVDALRRVFPELSKEQAKSFYGSARCGLFHDGMTRLKVDVENRFPARHPRCPRSRARPSQTARSD